MKRRMNAKHKNYTQKQTNVYFGATTETERKKNFKQKMIEKKADEKNGKGKEKKSLHPCWNYWEQWLKWSKGRQYKPWNSIRIVSNSLICRADLTQHLWIRFAKSQTHFPNIRPKNINIALWNSTQLQKKKQYRSWMKHPWKCTVFIFQITLYTPFDGVPAVHKNK